MKNPKFFLTTLFAAAAMTATAHAAGEIISINFGNSGNAITGGMTGTAGLATYDNGGVQTAVGAAGWANVSGNAQQTVPLKNYDGTLISGASVTARSDFATWGPYDSDGTVIRSLQGSYYDLANWGVGSWNVDIETTFLVCDVYVYLSGDGGQYGAVSVNGTFYKGDATNGSVEGSGAWGNRNYSDNLVLGTNALKVSGVAGAVSLTNERSTANRATLSGIQVVNAYDGESHSGTISGDTTWDGISFMPMWQNSQSSVSSTGNIVSTGGSYADLTLTADAALTLNQAVITDALFLSGSGELALENGSGSLTFSGPAMLKVGAGTVLSVNSADLVFAENVKSLTVAGSGTIRFTDDGGLNFLNDKISGGNSTIFIFEKALNLGTDSYTVSKGIQIFAGGITAGTVNIASGAALGVAKGTSLSIGNNDSASVKALNLGSGGLYIDGDLTVDVTSNVEMTGKLAGTGKVILTNSASNGAQLYINNNANDFSGTLVVSGGATAEMGNTSMYGGGSNSRLSELGSSVIVENGGVFRLHLGNNSFSSDIYLKGGATLGNRDGNATLTGNVYFGVAEDYNGSSLTYDENAVVNYTQLWRKDISFTGVLSGDGTVVFQSQVWEGGTASYSISNDANTFSGTYKVESAGNPVNLYLRANGAAKYANIELASGSSSKLQLAADAITIGGLSGTEGSVVAITGSVCDFTVNGGGDFAGNLAPGGAALRLIKDGEGTLTLTGTGNNYSGGTEVRGGTLVAGHGAALGRGSVTIAGGTLGFGAGMTSFERDITMSSGGLNVENADTFSVSSLTAGSGSVLSLGMLSTETAALTTTGSLTLDKGTIFNLSPALGGTEKITYILVEGATLGGITESDVAAMNRDNLLFGGLTATERVGAKFVLDGNVLKLDLVKPIFTDLVWIGGDGATWKYQGDTLWSSQIATETGASPKFENGDTTIFNTATSVAVEGAVQPGGMNVNADVTFTGVADSGASLALAAGTSLSVADGKTATIDASLATTGALKKNGLGTLSLTGKASSIFSSMQIAEGRVDLVSAESLKALFSADVSLGATLGIEIGENASLSALPAISGEGTIEKSGKGALGLSSSANFAGTLSVADGALNVSGGTISLGALNISGGTATFSGGSLSTTDGTTVKNAEVVISKGDSTSTLRGALTIENGGLVRLTAGDATGWGGGSGAMNALVINEGGELRIETAATGSGNQTFNMAGGITLQGGKITGTDENGYSKFDFFGDTAGITTLASDTTAEVSAGIGLRNSGAFSVEDGGAEIDLLVSGMLTSYGQVIRGEEFNAVLVKSGAGTLKLSGDNRYWKTGGTIDEGKLIAASATALGTGNIEVGMNATLEFTAESGVFANAISGKGNIVVNSTGTITLAGASSYEGPTSILAGGAIAGSANAFGTSAITLASGTMLGRATEASVVLGSLTTADNTILGVGLLDAAVSAFTVNGTATLGAGIKFDVDAATKSGIYALLSGESIDINLAELGNDDLLFGGVASGRTQAQFSLENNQLLVAFEKAVYTDMVWLGGDDAVWALGSDTLWKSEAAGGTATFENGDSVIFSTDGATVAMAGSVSVGGVIVTEDVTFSKLASATSAEIIVPDGKTFSVAEGKTAIFDKTVSTSGTIEKTGAGRLIFAADAPSLIDTAIITEGTFGLSVTDDTSTEDVETVTFSGVISGNGTFEKTGTGTLLISNDNSGSFSGNILISEGTVKLGHVNALGAPAVGITVGIGGTLDFNGKYDANYLTYVLDGGSLVNNGPEMGVGYRQFVQGFSLTADSFVGGTGNFGMISSGYGANRLDLGGNTLTKTGSNVFFLCNTTITAGGINIEGGTLRFVNRDVTIDGDVAFKITNDGVLGFNNRSMTLTEGSDVSVSGTFNALATITINKDASLDLTKASRKEAGGGSGVLNVNGGSVKLADFGWGAGKNFGANFNSDRISLSNGGILELTTAQTGEAQNRGFRVTAGTGTFRYTGTGTNVIAESADNNRLNVAGGATLAFDVVNADATVEVSKVINGTGTIEKTGAGTLILSGVNVHGGTVLSEGTLQVASAGALGAELSLAGGSLMKLVDSGEDAAFVGNVSVSAAAIIRNLAFADGTWTFAEELGTGFAGVSLTDVTFADITIDVSAIDFSEDDASVTLFTNYAGTDASVFSASGGTVTIDASKNVIFTAGSLYFTQIWDPNATAAENDKIWTSALFNGTDYSAANSFRKFKFLEKTGAATEAGTISGEVTAKRLEFLGDYSFTGTVDGDTAAKLILASGTDENGLATGTATVSVAEGKAAAFDKTIATEGSIEKIGKGKLILAADAASVISSATISEGTFGLSVADDAATEAVESVAFAGSLSGTGIVEKSGAGTLHFSGNNSGFSGNLVISEGTLLLTGANSIGSNAVKVIVEDGGTFDLNGVTDTNYGNFVLAGGLLVNNGNEMGAGSKQIAGGISLTADSVIGGASNFGMIASGWGVNTLDLAGNTLTKTGANAFFLCNTTITSGVIHIEEGAILLTNRVVTVGGDVTLSTVGEGVLAMNGTQLYIAAGKTLNIVGAFSNPGTINVNQDSILDLTQASRKEENAGNGTLNINGGTVRIADFGWGVGKNFGANFNSDRISLSNGGVLELTEAQTEEARNRGFRVTAGTGTFRYTGTETNVIAESADNNRLNVASGATMAFDIVNADATVEVLKFVSGAGIVEKIGAGTLVLSGENTHGGTKVSAGILKVGSDNALGAGPVTIGADGILETGLQETTSLANAIAGSGNFNVKGDTTLSGNSTFTGTYSVSDNAVLTVSAGTLGNGSETVKLSGASELCFAPTGGMNAGGKVVLEENAVLRNRGGDGVSTMLSSSVSGSGNIVQSSGELNLKFAKLGEFTGTLRVEGGSLVGFTLDDKVGSNTLALAGGTLEDLTVNKTAGTLSFVGTDAVSLTGDIALTVGTLSIESLRNEAYFTGTASVEIGDGFVFNFQNLALQDTDDPNTKTATVKLFDTTGLTLNGWDTLTFEDIRIGGRELDAHYDIVIGNDGDVSITLTSQTITWTAGATGTWDNSSANWNLDNGSGAAIIFADYDTVRFANDADITLSGELLPAEIVIEDNVTLSLSGDGKIVGGTTSLGTGSTLELIADDTAKPAFNNKVSGNGTFVLDNSVDVSVTNDLNGAYTLSGGVAFVKKGSGTFGADASQGEFTGATSVDAGKILVSATNALGTGAVTLNGGSLEISAAQSETVAVNNVIAGTTASDAPLMISGAGEVALTQANTYTGTTLVSGTALAQNAKAFGESSVEISGSVKLDAEVEFTSDFSGTGELLASKSATISGSVNGLTGTLGTEENVTLTLDTTGNFTGTTELAANSMLEKIGTGKFTILGTIESAADATISVTDGTLAVGNGTANQSFAGALSVVSGKTFEKLGTNTLTLSGGLSGTGSISVTDGTLAVGNNTADQSFAGSVSVAAGKTFEKVGNNTLTLSGTLSGTGTTQVSAGTLELNVANDATLNSVVSGAGTLKKSGSGMLTLATGTNVASVDLAAGSLAGVKLGTGGSSKLSVSGTGTTIGSLTMNGGILDVSAAPTRLSGTTTLSGGTVYLGDADVASFTLTGATEITDADSLVFNFTAVTPPTLTSPNTLGETATIVYKVFSLGAGASLTGWDASVLDKTNFTVGNGASLSDRANLTFGADGSVTIANTVYDLEWNAGDGVWTVGTAGSANWKHAANPNDTAYMNSDRVSFTKDVTVSLGTNVAPTSLSVTGGVDLAIAASESYKITGSGTVVLGENASLELNSGHDYTGETKFADGASLRLNLAANNAPQFKSNLTLAKDASGMLLVDTGKLGAAEVSDFDSVFTGTIGEGVWAFEKLGAGTLTVASKMNGFTAEDSVNVATGTLKLMNVGALGSAKTTIASGAVLEIASATDAEFALGFSGNGEFRKSGGGVVTIASSNAMFGGSTVVAEGTLKLTDDTALGDSRRSTSLEVARNAELELAFGGSFGKELKGEGTVSYALANRLILTADSDEFVGTFALKADDAVATAKQATSFGNGTIAFEGKNGALTFELTPVSGQSVADVFSGSFTGTGTVSVETGLGVAMTFAGSSADFEGVVELKNASKLIVEKGDALGNEKASLLLGKDAELHVGSAANTALAAQISGEGSLTKVGAGTVTLANGANDFAGMVTVKDGTLRTTSLSALGKTSQVLLESATSTLEVGTLAGKAETLNKVVRGNGNLSFVGGGVLNWTKAEKRFSGNLSVSERTTLNTSDFFKVESGSVVLDNGAVWNANGGFSVSNGGSVSLFAAQAPLNVMQSRASQTLAAGTQLNVGSFSAAANKSGSVVIEDIAITPTNGGTGALITFDVESLDDADTVRIMLTKDASVSLDKVAVEVTLDESVRSAWDVPEISFVYRDGEAVDVSGDVEDVTIIMADGTEVKYVYDSRTGNLSLSPVSPEMNLAYAAMVAMPTEAFNQDVQSLHRRMEQRRFDTLSNKDEWEFFAQAQSMSVENGSDRSDSATFDFSTYGALVGGDVRLSESTVFGMALAYDRGTADIHNSQGEITMDSYRATLYAGTVFNDYCFAEGGAHFGFSSYEIDRKGEYGDNKGDTDGWSAGLFATTGVLIPTSVENLYLTPYIGLSYLHTAVDKVEETGTRSMTTDDFEADSLRARIGIGSSYSFMLGETPTRFGLDAAYSQEFLDDEVDADVGATGVAYSRKITEKALPGEAISVGASFDFTLSENTGIFLNYTADFGMNSDITHRGNVGFRFTY